MEHRWDVAHGVVAVQPDPGLLDAYTVEVGPQRVIATLVAAVIGGLIALWLARADRADARPGTVVPPADIEPEVLACGTAAEASEST